jgi:hypothetical protein
MSIAAVSNQYPTSVIFLTHHNGPCTLAFEEIKGTYRVSFETSFDSKKTETGTETSFGTVRNKTFVSFVSLLYRKREFRCFD